MVLRSLFITALLFSAAFAAELAFDSGDESKVVLLSQGDASADVNVICDYSDGITVTENDLFTVGTPSKMTADDGHTNYTIPMNFNAGVGTDQYTVTCGSESVSGSVTVAGIVVKDGSSIVSGDSGSGVTVTTKSTFSVDAVGVDGNDADAADCSVNFRAASGSYNDEVESYKLTSSSLEITMKTNSGSEVVVIADFDCPAISYRGEDFETSLKITQPASTTAATASPASSSPELATAIVGEMDSPDLTAVIRVVNSSPTTLTADEARKIMNAVCDACGCGQKTLLSVVKGSAVMTVGLKDVDENGSKKIDDGFDKTNNCPIPTSLDMSCDELELSEVTVKAVAAPVAAAASGLPTWTIVVIAGVGAFALIALIMLGLLAVYRRSAEVSESDYSSSGPLGVPDPSDLLYEQSIVRDIYGRGDFPDGGPTAAVAEQRAREADLREEMPRPPSSSGLSRSTATDDASSTYSV